MLKVLGLINARAGSKTVKNKNIKNLCGLPLIAWTIQVALKSKLIQDVIVSTDSKKISKVANLYGAETPILRPEHLAKDNSKQFDVINYMIRELSKTGRNYDAVLLLQPTFPLRSLKDIDGSIKIMQNTKADTVISVSKCNSNLPYTLYFKDKYKDMRPLLKIPKKGTNRQNLKELYNRVGCIYLIKIDTILKSKSIYGKKIKSILIPDNRSFDIDTVHEWKLLESWIKTNKFDKKIL